MQHPHKSRFGLSTKLALGIVVVVGIVALLYYGPGDIGIPGLEGIGGSLDGLLENSPAAVAGERFDFVMQSSVSPIGQETLLQNASVSLSGVNSADTEAGNVAVGNSGKTSTIEAEDFNGKISIVNGTLSLSGTTGRIIVDGSEIKAKSGELRISVAMSPTSYSVYPVSMTVLSIAKTSGRVSAAQNSTINFASTDVEIVGFEGTLSGTANSHTVDGSATEVRSKSFSLKG